MKRIALALCVAAMALALAACSGGSGSSAASSSAASGSGSASAVSAASGSGSASVASAASGSAASASAASSAAAASSATAAKGSADYGWVSFDMPEGWVDANESDAYETIADAANSKHKIKIFKKTLSSSAPTAADYAAKEVADHADKYTDEGKKTIGNYEWNLVGFTFNNNPSVYAYADVAEKKCVYCTIYEMTVDDPAAQTVLSTLTVDASQL